MEKQGPNAVDFASLKNFDWLEAVEAVIRGFKPLRDELGLHNARKPFSQSVDLAESSQTSLADLPATFDARQRPFRKAGDAREFTAGHTELLANLGE